MSTATRPKYLVGAMAPVPDETEAHDLEVVGSLPPELEGRYFRNGSNPPPGVDPGHAFTGQGMLHGVRLSGGRALWYRNRWVREQSEPGLEPSDPRYRLVHNKSNTNVIEHGGRILSMIESGFPYEIDGNLETVGVHDFGHRLNTPMTAHPKEDPGTGDLHFFGIRSQTPHLIYHRADAAGQLVHTVEIDVPDRTMMHDFAITENHVVWLDLPVVFDMTMTGRPGMPYRWSDDYGSRIGIMPHHGGAADITWIDVTETYVYHVANAFEDEHGRIVLDAICYDRAAFHTNWWGLGGPEPSRLTTSGGVVHRWTVDPARATVSEQTLDEAGVEFPTVDDTLTGRRHRFVYATTPVPVVVEEQRAIVYKHDNVTGDRSTWTLPQGWVGGESTFVPVGGARREDDGWLVSVASHATADEARLLVIDAADVAAGPVAQVLLPRRVPVGFHGCWIGH